MCWAPLEVVNVYLSKILKALLVQSPEVSAVQLEPSALYSTVTKSPSVKLEALSEAPKTTSGM